VSDTLDSSTLADSLPYIVPRAKLADGDAPHDVNSTSFDRRDTSEPEHQNRHRGMSHLPPLLRYIATGKGPYEPAK